MPLRLTLLRTSVSFIAMKSPSPFSLLLFVHLITAAPLPSILLDRWRDRSCTKPGNTLPDQYLPIRDAPLAVEEAPAPEDIVTLITSTAALRVEECRLGAKLCNGFPARGRSYLTREVTRLQLPRRNLKLTNDRLENISYSFIIVSMRAYSWERSTTSTKGLPERLLLTT